MTKPAPTLAELLDHDPLLLAAAYAPVNRLIDDLLSRKTPAAEWLEQAGPISAELNERVRDGGSACSANPKGLEHE